jgi:hypothetical protein
MSGDSLTANHVEPQLRLFPGGRAATAVGGATPDESAHPQPWPQG